MSLTKSTGVFKNRGHLFSNLLNTIERIRPDYVLVPTGEAQNSGALVARLSGRRYLPGKIPGEIGIHNGIGNGVRSSRDRLEDAVHGITNRASLPFWRKMHYLNTGVYEKARARGGKFGRAAKLIPHPVIMGETTNKTEARRRLGLEEGGRLFGVGGLIDRRKAVVPTVQAFRKASSRADVRFIIAGRIDPYILDQLKAENADLIREGRLILWNRFLDLQEFANLFSALDVVCTPYPTHSALSSILLQGVAAGRPVLTHDYGWMGATVKKFGLGWACNVLDQNSLDQTVSLALEQAENYRQSEAVRRLIEFYSPENFGESWTAGVRETLGLPPSGRFITWESVVAATEETLGHHSAQFSKV